MSEFFKFIGYLHHIPADSTCVSHALHVNTSGKAGAQKPHPPWEMIYLPGGDNAVGR
jgi:hypothetical protein